jgi:type I restriction enzyme S subunit
MDVTMDRINREIELLREYQTRLVADVVTGKLDVRELAEQLRDESVLDITADDTDQNDESEATDEVVAL